MNEFAFVVKHDSDFYRQYFEAKEEKKKFHALASSFFEKNGLIPNKGYYQSEALSVAISKEQKEKLKGQIRKLESPDGIVFFRKNSVLQKKWKEEVVSQINKRLIDKTDFWPFPYLMSGSYAMWDYNGNIYGLLQSKQDNLKLPDFATQIKMSEYYRIIEKQDEQILDKEAEAKNE